MISSTVWVIVPAYNEGTRIKNVLSRLKKITKNIIVIDDGSKDNTSNIVRSMKVSVLRHAINLGKGAALKTGCDYAVSQGAKVLVVIDSDGQHEPEDIPRFLSALKNRDIVFGYRKLGESMPFVYRFGNWFINKVIRILYGMKLRDTQCGYRAFTKKAYEKIRWEASDYSMESEMIAHTGRHHLKYKEILIKTIYADRHKGTTVIDGVKIVLNLIIRRVKL
jgi:glycosyltransferase involved in cell wall biosynthesis